MPEQDLVMLERREGWAEIAINRPERRNSIIPPVSVAIADALDEVADDEDIACVLLRGEGGYFCSGVDLKALQAVPPPPWRGEHGTSWRDLHLKMFSYPKPVVCAFEKYGINAGAALAMACDILIAGETAFIQVGEVQQGAMAPMNLAWFRIKTTEQILARLAFYGDRIAGPDMLRLGLAAECVADDQVLARCREVCQRFAEFPAGATARIKRGIIEQRGIDDPEAYFRKPSSNALLGAKMVK